MSIHLPTVELEEMGRLGLRRDLVVKYWEQKWDDWAWHYHGELIDKGLLIDDRNAF